MKTSFSSRLKYAGAALLAVSALAYATVTFDSTSGTGFVGKGDVQLAFGWNNQAAQANMAGVTFSFNATDHYSAVCEWETGVGTRGQKTHDISLKRKTSVASAVQYDARTHKQIDGIMLTGFGDSVTSGTPPVVGDACVGNDEGIDHNGTYVSVDYVGSEGGLFVNYDSSSVQLL